uniref:Uncharacterized protein n=1 Tax=Anser cygnoides TaxID=8845 RepID=A0A8B9ES74_ANSCY
MCFLCKIISPCFHSALGSNLKTSLLKPWTFIWQCLTQSLTTVYFELWFSHIKFFITMPSCLRVATQVSTAQTLLLCHIFL